MVKGRWLRGVGVVVLAGSLGAGVLGRAAEPSQGPTSGSQGGDAATYSPGVALTADQITALLPQTVYFQGRTAPLQLRNAGAMAFAGGQIVWVSLVDSSGYATSVQEKYQFYLVTEGPLRVGASLLPAGAYGGGFVGDHFLIMDLGGHTVAQGPVASDAQLARPRPLQLRATSTSEATLYLGRRSVRLQSAAR